MEFNEISKGLDFEINPSNSKVLIFSDLHFYKHRGSEIFIEIISQVLKNIIDIADTNNIKTIWFLGDWFHVKDKIGTEELVITSKFLFSLKEHGIKILMIPGNHDMLMIKNMEYNTIQAFNVMDNVYIVNKYANWQYKDKSYHFFGYNTTSTQEITADLLSKKRTKNYFLGHIELNSLKINDNYEITSEKTNVTGEYLKSMFTMSFLGHYHNASKQKNILIIGSPYQQNFGEQTNDSYFFIYDCETDAIKLLKNEFSPKFKKIYLKDFDIKTEEDLDKIDFEKSFLKIILNKSIPSELLMKLKEKLIGKNYLVEMAFDYEDDSGEIAGIGSAENNDLKQKLSMIDFNNSANLKSFFKSYLDIFRQFPDGISKDKLKDIIDEIA